MEHPNGIKYGYGNDGNLAYGERTIGSNTYRYDKNGALQRIDQKITDTVERKVFIDEDGNIDYVNHYVNTSEGNKLVKEDLYFYDKNKIEEYFDINGNDNIYIQGEDVPINRFAKLKFWQSDWFKNLGKKAKKVLVGEEE